MVPGKGLAECVERAGADIAEHDADRAERELDHAVVGGMRVRAVRLVWSGERFRLPACIDVHCRGVRAKEETDLVMRPVFSS